MKTITGLLAFITFGTFIFACSAVRTTPDPRAAIFEFLRERASQGHVGEEDYYIENPGLIAGSVPEAVRPLIRDIAESVLHSDGRIYDKSLKRTGVRLFIWDVAFVESNKVSAKAAYYSGYDGGTSYEITLRLVNGLWKIESSSIRVQS